MADTVFIQKEGGPVLEIPTTQEEQAMGNGYSIIPANLMEHPSTSGLKLASPEDVSKFNKELEYTTPGQKAIAGLEGGLDALTLGGSSWIERGLGISDPEHMALRSELNSGSRSIGSGAGILGGLLATGGASGVGKLLLGAPRSLATLGEGAAAASGLGEGVLGSLSKGALSAGGEGAGYGTGEVIHQAALEKDPSDYIKTKAIPTILLSAASGAGLGAGGVLGSKVVAPWLDSAESYLYAKQLGIPNIKSDLNDAADLGLVGPYTKPATTIERSNTYLKDNRDHVEDLVSQAWNIKSDLPIAEAGEGTAFRIPTRLKDSQDLLNRTDASLAKNQDSIPKPLFDELQQELGSYREAMRSNAPSPTDLYAGRGLFDPTDLLKYRYQLEGIPQAKSFVNDIDNIVIDSIPNVRGGDKFKDAYRAAMNGRNTANTLIALASKAEGARSGAMDGFTPDVIAGAAYSGLGNAVKNGITSGALGDMALGTVGAGIGRRVLGEVATPGLGAKASGLTADLLRGFKPSEVSANDVRKFDTDKEFNSTFFDAVNKEAPVGSDIRNNLEDVLKNSGIQEVKKSFLDSFNPTSSIRNSLREIPVDEAASSVAREDSKKTGIRSPIRSITPEEGAFSKWANGVIKKGEEATGTAVRTFLDSSGKLLPSAALGAGIDYATTTERINRLANDPRALIDLSLKATQDISEHAPKVGAELMGSTGNAISYLKAAIPHSTPATAFSPAREPSKIDVQNFNKKFWAITNPSEAIKHLGDSSILEAMQTVYPNYVGSYSADLLKSIAQTNKVLSYQQQQEFSKIIGEPLNPSLTPASISSLQNAFVSDSKTPKGPKIGSDKLNIGKRYLTSTQKVI